MMVLIAITAVFYLLSARNDQALIVIISLLLVSIVWALQSSILRYMNELKIFNTGAISEK